MGFIEEVKELTHIYDLTEEEIMKLKICEKLGINIYQVALALLSERERQLLDQVTIEKKQV